MDTKEKLEKTKEHWENSNVESLKDSNLRTLEINSIVSFLQEYTQTTQVSALADFGCGDGYDTHEFAQFSEKTIGYDYSKEMLSRAKLKEKDNLRFEYLDLIAGEVSGHYDAAITKRFIINLGDWKIQSKCIDKIDKIIKPGGIFIMLECYKQGFDNINKHRKNLGLELLKEPYHNTYLNYDEMLTHMNKNFSLVDTVDFSTYYYLTRCLAPKIADDSGFDMDEKIRLAAESDDILEGSRIGPQTLMCWQKR